MRQLAQLNSEVFRPLFLLTIDKLGSGFSYRFLRAVGGSVDFVEVEPLPDELAHSILARLAFQNCCDSNTVIAKLARFYGIPKSENHFSVVSQALGYQNSAFLKKHTLYPLMRAVDRGTLIDLAKRTVGFRAFFGPKTNAAAFYCPRCSDMELDGNSVMFWRRAHHLPSVDWCPTHFCSLEQYAGTASEYPTSESKVVGAPIVLVAGVEHARNPVLLRYGALLMAWREKEIPYRSSAVCNLILDACNEQGLGNFDRGGSRLLSDALAQSLPHSWVSKYMQQLASKNEGEINVAFDLYLERRFTSLTTRTVALLLAYLFGSVESIESALNAVG